MKNVAPSLASPPVQLPAHEVVYQQLREQILFGEMAPGQPVTIQGLTTSLGVGMTPVREAIRRLTSDGALVFQGNRRVSVPELNADDIEQITYLRITIEQELIRRTARTIGKPDLDRLVEIDDALDQAIQAGNVAEYLRGNYHFHCALYAQANAPVVAEIADRLWLRFGPSLRVVCGRFGTQSLPDCHKDILNALKKGDAETAADALVRDIEQGMGLIAEALAEDC